MYRITKFFLKLIVALLFIISFIGFILSLAFNLVSYFSTGITYSHIWFALGMPFIAPIGFVMGIIKTAKSRENINKYGIRFWPAIRNVPNWNPVVNLYYSSEYWCQYFY